MGASPARRARDGLRICLAVLSVLTATALQSASSARAASRQPSITPSSAAALAVHVVEWIGHGRYDVAWRHLHPLHQAVAPLDRYVACEIASPLPQVIAVDVLAVHASLVAVPGIANPVPGYSVALRSTFTEPQLPPFSVRHTVHIVAVHGRPVWILPLKRYDAYRDRRCP